MEAHPDPWPFRHLVLRTPRVELRPDDDAGVRELVEESHHGVHPPEVMPFEIPWTDTDPTDRGRETLQHYWSVRAALAPVRWTVNFLVRLDGRVIGVQSVVAVDFAVTREIDTGSWIGLRHQRRGLGTEMRAAVLVWAFDHLGATRARSAAFLDNTASLRVSAKLGYRGDGGMTGTRRGERAEKVRLLVTPDTFARPAWTPRVEGLDACRPLLGLSPG